MSLRSYEMLFSKNSTSELEKSNPLVTEEREEDSYQSQGLQFNFYKCMMSYDLKEKLGENYKPFKTLNQAEKKDMVQYWKVKLAFIVNKGILHRILDQYYWYRRDNYDLLSDNDIHYIDKDLHKCNE